MILIFLVIPIFRFTLFNMPFKVVYIEHLKEIEPVPAGWEINGFLFWPPSNKLVRKFQQDQMSIPDKTTWKKYACAVKKKCTTFKQAAAEADKFCDLDTTEDERDARCSDYDTFFEEQQHKHTKQPEKLPQENSNNFEHNTENVIIAGQAEALETNVRTVSPKTINVPFIEMVPNDQFAKEFQRLHEALLEFKEECNRKLTEINLKIDNITKNYLNPVNIVESFEAEIQIFPFTSTEDVDKFELQLNEKDFYKKIQANLQRVVGFGIASKPACYKLCDTLFTKGLLTSYSWTGVSRSTPKKTFNILGNILGLFFKVVHTADNSFSYAERDSFFRDCVLKHSQSRIRKLEPKGKNKTVPDEEVQENEEPDLQ